MKVDQGTLDWLTGNGMIGDAETVQVRVPVVQLAKAKGYYPSMSPAKALRMVIAMGLDAVEHNMKGYRSGDGRTPLEGAA